jgi:hypothetical protein
MAPGPSQLRITFSADHGEILVIANFNLFTLTPAERKFFTGLSDYLREGFAEMKATEAAAVQPSPSTASVPSAEGVTP